MRLQRTDFKGQEGPRGQPLIGPEDWLVFVDESGDHSIGPANDEYPIFIMVACRFRRDQYCGNFVPELASLKVRHWGHEGIILHEREIRRPQGDFTMLLNPVIREAFHADLGRLVKSSGATIHAVAWDKRIKGTDESFAGIYGHCLGRLYEELASDSVRSGKVRGMHWVLESRGKAEDGEAQRAAAKIGAGAGMKPVIVSKRRNVAGLQLADLCARPIGTHLLNPTRESRAFNHLLPIIHRPSQGPVSECGLVALLTK